ncbi:MAG: Serine/threonine-protein phosphatase 2A activator 1 [Pycnora praestabilis]|nr:MAG: Serine/threonine-protein phosphatase 2A activator 1 [Pycnora praestabilis]
MTEGASQSSSLRVLDPSLPYTFFRPTKRINEGQDVSSFLTSRAYSDIMTFLFQLNGSLYPRRVGKDGPLQTIHEWELDSSEVTYSETVVKLRKLLQRLEDTIDKAPPDTGPRRFGNVSFRKWYDLVESQTANLLEEFLPEEVLSFGGDSCADIKAKDELGTYLLGSFGSAQRLDYGSGHELSFLAFLGCLWMLGGFSKSNPGVEERGIVLGVFEPYLHLIRRLIKTYNLEPAGSHGVWGLDDHSFIPYIFGSAQLAPAISSLDQIPAEGSLSNAPDPAGVAKAAIVERERKRNMYFGAVGFIYDVKKGPFWEHSPILYDISGVRAGWAKINKGMIKMYNAEVLSKFPVVQHFPFGSLFSWEHDPKAGPPPTSVHTSNQPDKPLHRTDQRGKMSMRAPQEGTKAPWAEQSSSSTPVTRDAGELQATKAPWASLRTAATPMSPMKQTPTVSSSDTPPWTGPVNLPTRAPWAKRQSPTDGH